MCLRQSDLHFLSDVPLISLDLSKRSLYGFLSALKRNEINYLKTFQKYNSKIKADGASAFGWFCLVGAKVSAAVLNCFNSNSANTKAEAITRSQKSNNGSPCDTLLFDSHIIRYLPSSLLARRPACVQQGLLI